MKGDYNDPKFLAATFANQDVVICTVSPTAIEAQFPLVEAAHKAGVKRFIPSEFSSDTARDNLVEFVGPVYQNKRAVIGRLNELAKDGKFGWTAIVCGVFFESECWLKNPIARTNNFTVHANRGIGL